MSNNSSPSNINQTFIIEPLSITGGTPTISACTSVYTNSLVSCSGDTAIFLGNGIVSVDGNINTNDNVSANTFFADYYYSGGTPLKANIINIITGQTIGFFLELTGGTLTGPLIGTTASFTNLLSNTITSNIISGTTLYGDGSYLTNINDFYTTGVTLSNNILSFNRNDLMSAYNVDLSVYSSNTYTTGATLNYGSKTLSLNRNDGVDIFVSLPFRLLFTAATTTISNNIVTIDTISAITNNKNSFIISYVSAYKDNIDYGFWKRTLALNKVSGVLQIIGENSDFDRISSGLTSNNVIYSASSGNLIINISGETAKNYTWSSNWEIIN